MKRLLKYTIPMMLIAFMVASCEYESVAPVEIDPDTELSFKNDIIPIFNESCNSSGCHATGDWTPDLTPENAYEALFAGDFIDTTSPANSDLYESMNSGSMKIYSTPEAMASILQWIEQGAKNN
ncbi:MAG: hypothetical protein U5L09_16725 [Bacteroidales bacterium]|nr:hypothetical protein [Bacteroidales bacterium]